MTHPAGDRQAAGRDHRDHRAAGQRRYSDGHAGRRRPQLHHGQLDRRSDRVCAYAWHADGVANGGTTATYTVVPEDSGKSLACQVTATNAMGSTAAPMSNAVAVA